MHILMVTDAYPPMRTSCAVQMHDLARAFIEEGHRVTVITPDSSAKESIRITQQNGVRLLQVKAFETKEINYVSRTIAEFINPFVIWHKLKKNPDFLNTQYDGIIWYSPTIFWGPLIKRIKQLHGIKAYLVLRDIFPDWALDLGLIKKGLSYKFLKAVEYFQYQQADVIGVQSPNNLGFFRRYRRPLTAKIEILWNWVANVDGFDCSINFKKTAFADKKIFIYAGNMGVAQGVDNLILLAEVLEGFQDAGLALVGRGSEVDRLKIVTKKKNLKNVLFFEEILHAEVQGLLKQCACGVVTLNRKHSNQNIPGKFLSYLSSDLPVLAFLNQGNDLIQIIREHQLGEVCVDISKDKLSAQIHKLINQYPSSQNISLKRHKLLNEIFSPRVAYSKIAEAFNQK